MPQGCIYAGVAGQAWYIAISRRGKVAVEAASYTCANPWAGRPIYSAYLNTQDIDGAPGDIQIADAPSQAGQAYSQQTGAGQPGRYPSSPYSSSADFGGPALPDGYLAGTSANIYGRPAGCRNRTGQTEKEEVTRVSLSAGFIHCNDNRALTFRWTWQLSG